MKKIFTILGIASALLFNAQIVINEVYGAGGNTGAITTNDYVELKNIGTSQQTLTGASLQYASATGNFNGYQALPTITLDPGQTYLIQQGVTGTIGANPMPTADFVATTNTAFSNGTTYNNPFAFAATAGKVALASDLTQVTSPTGSNVIDFVGWGTTATIFEGSAPAPNTSTTLSISRISGDTNNNGADFATGTPSPTNSAGQTLAVSDVNATKARFVKNTLVDNSIEFTAKANVKIYNINGQLVKAAAVNSGSSLDVSTFAKGVYVVAGEVDGKAVSQKIIKK